MPKKIGIDHDDYEWEDNWDDKALAAWQREEAEKKEAKEKAKDKRKKAEN